MNKIMQELSFNLHHFTYQMGNDDWVKLLLEKFGTPLKKEYLKLLFNSHKITILDDYENEENIMKILEINTHIQLFLNELERLEVKDETNKYLNLISESSKLITQNISYNKKPIGKNSIKTN